MNTEHRPSSPKEDLPESTERNGGSVHPGSDHPTPRTPQKDVSREEGLRFDSIEEALQDIACGKMIILVDDEDRENEGDLVCAAELVTAETINFMATHGRGLICLAMAPHLVDRLALPLMVDQNEAPLGTNFTVSIEAREGVSTGISAADRAHTIRTAIAPAAGAKDVVSPGHVFPLRARAEGVLARAGQTEGSVDLARLAGLRGAGVICEIMDDDGTMARYPALRRFADRFNLKLCTIADLIAYRRSLEHSLVRKMVESRLPTRWGFYRIVGFEHVESGEPYTALTMGVWEADEPVLTRVHSSCLTGDVFHSTRCDCGEQLDAAMRLIAEEGKGVLVYLAQEGRGIGLIKKLHAYNLQDGGLDTVEANLRLGLPPDLRDYGVGAHILTALGVRKMRLMTNNPRKIVALRGHQLAISERVPLQIRPGDHNRRYLRTKRDKLGHLLQL